MQLHHVLTFVTDLPVRVLTNLAQLLEVFVGRTNLLSMSLGSAFDTSDLLALVTYSGLGLLFEGTWGEEFAAVDRRAVDRVRCVELFQAFVEVLLEVA